MVLLWRDMKLDGHSVCPGTFPSSPEGGQGRASTELHTHPPTVLGFRSETFLLAVSTASRCVAGLFIPSSCQGPRWRFQWRDLEGEDRWRSGSISPFLAPTRSPWQRSPLGEQLYLTPGCLEFCYLPSGKPEYIRFSR